jgi:hypothetical protein
MCDCDVYRAYDVCECKSSKDGEAQAYVKFLKMGYEKMRAEHEETRLQLEKQQLLYKKQIKKHAKDGKKLAELQRLVQEYEWIHKVDQEQKDHIKMLEKKVKEKEEEMQGSRMTLRHLNKLLMDQNKMLKIENVNLKNILNDTIHAKEGAAAELVTGDIEWMTKTQLKSVIADLKQHTVLLEEELDNKEKMLNSASLCYLALKEELEMYRSKYGKVKSKK